MSKHLKASPADKTSATESRQKQTPQSSQDKVLPNYPQSQLDNEDEAGLAGLLRAARRRRRRRSMTDQEKLAALRAILTPPSKTINLDGPVQIVDRTSYYIEVLLSEIAIRQWHFDEGLLVRINQVKERLEKAEAILE